MKQRRENIFIAKFETFIIEKHGKHLADEIMHAAYDRYTDLAIENEESPLIDHEYTRVRALAGIAIFDALVKSGRTREEAADLILLYYMWRSAKFGRKMKNILKIPFMYKLAPYAFNKLTIKMFQKSAGFERKNHKSSASEVSYNMVKCPYMVLSEKYNCPEIVKAYCYADIVCFGDLHKNLVFERPTTLHDGDESCAFRFGIKK